MLSRKKSLSLALAVLLVVGASLQPFRPMVVIGDSMAPTYANGSVLLTTPVDRPLVRGDVVVVDTPTGPIVKRIALLPGDHRYQLQNPDGWYDMPRVVVPHHPHKRTVVRSVPVPAGTIYVLGDNLELSTDSRSFGPVDAEKVVRLIADQRDPDVRSGAQKPTVRAWLALARSLKGRHS